MQYGVLRITLLIPLFSLFFCACNQSEWKGTIEVKNGVTFVKNPKEPLYSEMKLHLEEELSIKGISENGDFIFAEVSSLAVDANENIFICDRKEASIKKFDRNGNFLATIGGRGQGPGEMSDPDLNPRFMIGTMPYQQNMRAINPFAPVFTCAVDQNDNIVYGYPDTYEIQIYGPQGNILKKITKKYDAVPVTDAEKEEEKSKAPPYAGFNFPDTHSAFQSIKVDAEGRIFVKTWKNENPRKGFYYDIFDSQGRYIAEIFLEAMPFLFRNHKLYAIEEDDGFQVVKRYSVTWSH